MLKHLTVKDILVLSLISLFFAVCSFLYSIGTFNVPKVEGFSAITIDVLMKIPAGIIIESISSIIPSFNEQTSVTISFALTIANLLLTFILWFLVFYLLNNAVRKSIGENTLIKNIFPIALLILFIICLFTLK